MRNANHRRASAAKNDRKDRFQGADAFNLKGFSARKAQTPRYKAIAEFSWDEVPVFSGPVGVFVVEELDSYSPSRADRKILNAFLDLS